MSQNNTFAYPPPITAGSQYPYSNVIAEWYDIVYYRLYRARIDFKWEWIVLSQNIDAWKKEMARRWQEWEFPHFSFHLPSLWELIFPSVDSM